VYEKLIIGVIIVGTSISQMRSAQW